METEIIGELPIEALDLLKEEFIEIIKDRLEEEDNRKAS